MLESKISKLYERHNCSRICQGDILRDFEIIEKIIGKDREVLSKTLKFNYIVILSQDCDLEQYFDPTNRKKEKRFENNKEVEIEIFNQYLTKYNFVTCFSCGIIESRQPFKGFIFY